MAIKPATPNFDAAARDSTGKFNIHQDQAFRSLHERLNSLERATGLQGTDPDLKTKLAKVPPRAQIAVNGIAGTGNFTVSITNPEFQASKGNPLRTPIYHKLQYSADSSFRSGVHELPPSTQTHWPIPSPPKSKYHFRLASSFDGVNWNLPIVTPGISA